MLHWKLEEKNKLIFCFISVNVYFISNNKNVITINLRTILSLVPVLGKLLSKSN